MNPVSSFFENLFGIAKKQQELLQLPDRLTGEIMFLDDPDQQQSYYSLRQALNKYGYRNSVAIVMRDGKPVGEFRDFVLHLNMHWALGVKPINFNKERITQESELNLLSKFSKNKYGTAETFKTSMNLICEDCE